MFMLNHIYKVNYSKIIGEPMNYKDLLYEGKSKRVYINDEKTLLLEFKDEVTALDGAKVDKAPGKGILNAAISSYFFRVLEVSNVKTHYISYDGNRSLIVKRLNMIPLEVIVRNYAYGSLIKRLPLFKPLTKLQAPIVEFHFKSDKLHDPLVLPEDVVNAGMLASGDVHRIREEALRINDILTRELDRRGLTLIDFKVEFGRDPESGELILADEISGDTIRVINEEGSHLDKEIYRSGGSVKELIQAYMLLACKLGIKDIRVAEFGIYC